MAITLKLCCLLQLLLLIGCRTTNETMVLCDVKYDVYKYSEYDYEQKLYATSTCLCFHNSKYFVFAFQTAGVRNDSNLVRTILNQKNDTLVVTTFYSDNVYGYPKQHVEYFKCLRNGVIRIGAYSNSNIVITKKTSRKMWGKFKL